MHVVNRWGANSGQALVHTEPWRSCRPALLPCSSPTKPASCNAQRLCHCGEHGLASGKHMDRVPAVSLWTPMCGTRGECGTWGPL